ncbi:MAG: hypothetical protein HY896_02305 [Deltaproteobacteria bacterium]|nr:hypothetical protein [Deltaproteobacteria bacterium]
MKSLTALALAFALLAFHGIAAADMKGHESMPGMKGHESMPGMQGHGEMMKMGDKIFGGKVGPWQGEARLIDMKASMEKAKASGMKMEGQMKSHHFEIFLTDLKTKKAVTEGKGTVTVTGPDKKTTKTDIAAMAGHFGVDVDLPKPGKYTFKVAIESGKEKGGATFSHTLK